MGSCTSAVPPGCRDTAGCLTTILARCSRPSGGNGRGSRGDGDCVSNRSYLKLFVDCLEKYQKLNDTEFGRLVRAALRYKATGAEPGELGREALVWDGMRLDIDRDNESYTATCSARAEAGRKGAEARWQNHSKNSKNGKSHLPYSKNGQDKEEDKDKDKDIAANAANAREAVLSAVLSHYQDCITPTPPSTVAQLLIAYTDDLGADVVIHAIDEAVNQRKLTWGYIQAILQRYSRERLNTLAKVEADEAERRKRTDAGTDKPAPKRDWGVRYTVDGREGRGNQ